MLNGSDDSNIAVYLERRDLCSYENREGSTTKAWHDEPARLLRRAVRKGTVVVGRRTMAAEATIEVVAKPDSRQEIAVRRGRGSPHTGPDLRRTR